MSRSLGARLPPDLRARLSQSDLPARLGAALPFVTVDGAGRPHAMLLSYIEIRAYDAATLGLVIDAGSGTARNLSRHGVATLLIVEPGTTMYVKSRLIDGPLEVAAAARDLAYFLLAVDDVLEDSAAEWEGGAQITSGVQYRPLPSLDAPWVRATLAAVAVPRARV
ncbi:MAG TPA: pyridoxamine 5'-phosphate oxidase family protein [Methylomirabilota bacterium]|nr:pyridoxamine 5'-phosphate oxidase family protein [Methylomirabilota bacterium]